MLESFENLESLSLIGCGLRSLENLPNLPNLIDLDLCDNKISLGLEMLNRYQKLESLSLAGNPIANYETLLPLSSFQSLQSLDLYGCKVSDKPDFHEKMFELIKSLITLNGLDIDKNEVSSTSSESENEEEGDLDGFVVDDSENEDNFKRPFEEEDENLKKSKSE